MGDHSLPSYLQEPALAYRYRQARATALAKRAALPFPAFANAALRIRTKDMRIVPLRLNAVQQHLHAHHAPRMLIVKARQTGISTYFQARSFWRNITRTSSSLTIADTDATTMTLRRIYRLFYDLWPENAQAGGLRLPRPEQDRQSDVVITYSATTSSSVIVTAGSKSGGHGATYSDIHFSEVAHWNDPETIFARALQGATPDAEVVLESTPNGAQGLFYELCMKALDGDKAWALRFYPWWWAGEYALPLDKNEKIVYTEEEKQARLNTKNNGFVLSPEQIKWRRAKQNELGRLFYQEYPETIESAFLGFAGRIYDNFDARYNVSEQAEYNPAWPVRWAVDDGYAHGDGPGTASYHPRVILLMQQTGRGHIHVFTEYVVTRELSEVSIKRVKKLGYPDPEVTAIDSSASEMITRLAQQSIVSTLVYPATHRVSEGIKWTRQLICDAAGERSLLIHPRCQHLIRELRAYRYDANKAVASAGERPPLKVDDHTCDALRYGIWSYRYTV